MALSPDPGGSRELLRGIGLVGALGIVVLGLAQLSNGVVSAVVGFVVLLAVLGTMSDRSGR